MFLAVSLPFDRIESVSQREFRPKMPNAAAVTACFSDALMTP
jgi:hypothetical protein